MRFYVEFWISETNDDEDDMFDFVFNEKSDEDVLIVLKLGLMT